MQEAVIIDCLRTPVGKAPRGTLRNARPDELAAIVIRRLLEKYPQVAPADVEDVILGCADNLPEVYINMGLTAENVQRKYNIARDEQDSFSFRSHQNALRAQAEGKFEDELVPVEVQTASQNGAGKPKVSRTLFAKDEGPRADTTPEALAKLKPAFHAQGTVTAGNSSQMSDGAAAALVMSEKKARELGLKPMARFVSFAVGGVPPEIMGVGPVVAIPKALALAGLTLDNIGLIELNEAFAVQALAVARTARLDMQKLNVNG